ncbi:hypothetical protein BKA70DRAFT_226987 [Coprinopsis sp. MPI-PUGE-AT-0042]|nr:hypothetical protein BKA70DRAFT_226987 [Coprinopsis sp. MPI-PUGE-AT-0042]
MLHLNRSDLPSESQREAAGSTYTLNTVAYNDNDDDARSPLLSPATPNYGATVPRSPGPVNTRRIVFNAMLKMAVLLVLGTAFLGGVLWIALPTLEEADRPMLKIPKSFAELQALNILLKKYRDIYPYRIVVCYVVTYLYLQAFSLPGSMYLSILGGAVWGVPRALPLACCCVATGATLCYLISAVLGPALLVIPRWRALMDKWGDKIQANKENMISFLIVLRIAPFPPHWVVNVVCPHVGIGIIPFWISTALGIVGVSVIHTTIGGGLDEMTSPADFHLISWRNFFGLAAIVVGVMIPVGLRYWFRREVAIAEEVPEGGEVDEDPEDTVIAVGPPPAHKKFSRNRPLLQQDGAPANYSSDEDDDGDVILESGPAIDDGKAPKPDAPLIVLDPSPSSSVRAL